MRREGRPAQNFVNKHNPRRSAPVFLEETDNEPGRMLMGTDKHGLIVPARILAVGEATTPILTGLPDTKKPKAPNVVERGARAPSRGTDKRHTRVR